MIVPRRILASIKRNRDKFGASVQVPTMNQIQAYVNRVKDNLESDPALDPLHETATSNYTNLSGEEKAAKSAASMTLRSKFLVFDNQGQYDSANANTTDGYDDDFNNENLDDDQDQDDGDEDDGNSDEASYSKSDSIANIEPSINSLNTHNATIVNKGNSTTSRVVTTAHVVANKLLKPFDIKNVPKSSTKSTNGPINSSNSGEPAPSLADAVNAFRTIKAFLQSKISTIESTLENLNSAEQVVVETFGDNSFDLTSFFANK
jgi:hypothetical protein